MSGEIIEFQRHHDLKRARFYRKQAVARDPTGHAQLEQQIARIADLLGELEDLSHGAKDLPSPLLGHTRASIEKTHRILKSCAQFVESAVPEEDSEGDPQPDVDREILERMYRELNPQR